VLIHGLFGSLDNLGLLARPLSEQYRVISVDLRNHGASFHSGEMSYPQQGADVIALLDQLGLEQVALVGHSMGGKVAMQVAKQAPARVDRLVVADIAPVAYPHARHQNVFAGLNATLERLPQSRIMGWPDDQTRFEGQTLFIKGGDSDYMQPQYTETVMAQFPAAKARIIAGTGHWLHAEKPALFNKLVVDFLSTGG